MNMGLSEPGRLFRYFAKKTNKKFDFFLKIVYNIYTKLRKKNKKQKLRYSLVEQRSARLPVTQKIAGSNPVKAAKSKEKLYQTRGRC